MSPTDTTHSQEPVVASGKPTDAAPTTETAPSSPVPEAGRMTLLEWAATGLKAACCMRIDVGRSVPSPLQVFLLLIVPYALQLLLARWEVAGAAVFSRTAWMYPLFGLALLTFGVWAALTRSSAPDRHPAPVAAWLALWMVALFPLSLVTSLFMALFGHGLLSKWQELANKVGGLFYMAMWLWLLAIIVRVVGGVAQLRSASAVLLVGAMSLQGVATWQYSSRPWTKDYAQTKEPAAQGLSLTQEVFEDQQALLKTSLDSLPPRLAGRINVYSIVFAPYAQNVFVRESEMVSEVLEDRFLAKGRVIRLVNHASTTQTVPWATNKNLEASIQAAARRMDLGHDVLLVYLTSHGGGDFKLATSHWPLDVDELTPALLRKMLDSAGINNRVIAVSACYSGGWIPALQSDTTLVMTASDATHTSFGCGNKSPLTYFGRAFFDEQLRTTHSFETAFARAVPVIQQREIDGNKKDGFSNPQISVGKDIRSALEQLEQELGRGL